MEGRDGIGCSAVARGWLAEGSMMACFELRPQACLGIPFSSSLSSTAFRFRVALPGLSFQPGVRRWLPFAAPTSCLGG